jgi:hypothetical protein
MLRRVPEARDVLAADRDRGDRERRMRLYRLDRDADLLRVGEPPLNALAIVKAALTTGSSSATNDLAVLSTSCGRPAPRTRPWRTNSIASTMLDFPVPLSP